MITIARKNENLKKKYLGPNDSLYHCLGSFHVIVWHYGGGHTCSLFICKQMLVQYEEEKRKEKKKALSLVIVVVG